MTSKTKNGFRYYEFLFLFSKAVHSHYAHCFLNSFSYEVTAGEVFIGFRDVLKQQLFIMKPWGLWKSKYKYSVKGDIW